MPWEISWIKFDICLLSSFVSVLNCVRLLIRILPYIFEDPDWRGFFWSTLPGQAEDMEVLIVVYICLFLVYNTCMVNDLKLCGFLYKFILLLALFILNYV